MLPRPAESLKNLVSRARAADDARGGLLGHAHVHSDASRRNPVRNVSCLGNPDDFRLMRDCGEHRAPHRCHLGMALYFYATKECARVRDTRKCRGDQIARTKLVSWQTRKHLSFKGGQGLETCFCGIRCTSHLLCELQPCRPGFGQSRRDCTPKARQCFDGVKLPQGGFRCRRRDGDSQIVGINGLQKAARQTRGQMLDHEKFEALCGIERRPSSIATPSMTIVDEERSTHDAPSVKHQWKTYKLCCSVRIICREIYASSSKMHECNTFRPC